MQGRRADGAQGVGAMRGLVSEHSVFDLANIAIAGFAAVSAVLLLLAYAVLIDVPGKSIYSVGSCAALVAALTTIQIGHLAYFTGGGEPLERFHYRLALFVAPPAF